MTSPLTLDPTIAAHIAAINSFDNDGLFAVRCRYDGDYDKTNLPDPLIMTNYVRVRDGKVVTLFVLKNSDLQY